tara:strand:- start:13264 stop:14370 length:1107 start_codon:yes stop_codon:yes gene_type:complete
MNNPLQIAIFSSDFNRVKELIENDDMDVNTKLNPGNIPILHTAIGMCDTRAVVFGQNRLTDYENAKKILLFLLEKNADVTATDNSKWTSLHVACNRQTPEFINILIKKGANINAQTHNGNTPLHLALTVPLRKNIETDFANYRKIIHALMINNANAYIKNVNGYTPILHLIQYVHTPWSQGNNIGRIQLEIANEEIDKIATEQVFLRKLWQEHFKKRKHDYDSIGQQIAKEMFLNNPDTKQRKINGGKQKKTLKLNRKSGGSARGRQSVKRVPGKYEQIANQKMENHIMKWEEKRQKSPFYNDTIDLCRKSEKEYYQREITIAKLKDELNSCKKSLLLSGSSISEDAANLVEDYLGGGDALKRHGNGL